MRRIALVSSLLLLFTLFQTTQNGWTGLMGLTFDSNRPIESKTLH